MLTATGLVAIEQIKAGDRVISTAPETFETAEKTVLETYIRKDPKLIHLTINGEEIITTETHPFYVKDRGFVNAGELAVGDCLLDVNSNVLLVEDFQVEYTDEPTTVYNFQVEDFHTYYVGEQCIWVHNAEYDNTGKPLGTNTEGDGAGQGADEIKPFEAPKVFRNETGKLTNGIYTIDEDGMLPHIDGSEGKSQFLFRVDAEKAVLDAAALADEDGLWALNNPTKAKVYVVDGPVGVMGDGETTSFINVYRTRTGYVHGSPGTPQ